MTIIDVLRKELEQEAKTTRKHLERLPGDRLGWRPHEKSFTVLSLASHIVECLHWAESIFTLDELDFDPATYKACRVSSVADLLQAFDDQVSICDRVLAGAADADLMQPWRFKIMGRVRFEKPRMVVFRDFTLSHLVHHRGQLSVYLRLLDLPVPGSYGPSADERI